MMDTWKTGFWKDSSGQAERNQLKNPQTKDVYVFYTSMNPFTQCTCCSTSKLSDGSSAVFVGLYHYIKYVILLEYGTNFKALRNLKWFFHEGSEMWWDHGGTSDMVF